MRINIFEGARRLARLSYALVTVAALWWAVAVEPSVYIYYRVPGPGAPALPVEKCESGEASEYRAMSRGWPADVFVVLCFQLHRSELGQMLVPYRNLDEGRWLMGEPNSAEVTEYTRYAAKFFQPPSDIDKGLRGKKIRAQVEHWSEALGVAAGLVCFFWAMSTCAGWVVRGFLGIERGRDFRGGAM